MAERETLIKNLETEAEKALGIRFVEGGRITLRESLQFVDKGSRSPHPGGGNNMTTILMQLGVPTTVFWEVNAGLSGYEVVRLGDKPVSKDDDKCGPWAQFDTSLLPTSLDSQSSTVADIIMSVKTPFQAHMAIAKTAFPGVVESSASFYLRNIQVVEPILQSIAESPQAGSFSKLVKRDGALVPVASFSGKTVEFSDGTRIRVSELAQSYVNLLQVVLKSEQDPNFNPVDSGIQGVLIDSRIMTVLDGAIYALNAKTDRVYAWAGTAMRQYILREAHSERWREVTSAIYQTARSVLPLLPEGLEFVLIPTNGLGKLAVSDEGLANDLNKLISVFGTPPEASKNSLQNLLIKAARNMPVDQITNFLSQKTPNIDASNIQKMVDEGNIAGACGVVATQIDKNWRKDNRESQKEMRQKLGKLLRTTDGNCILDEQPTITPLEALQGKKLFLLEGVLDTPTGRLEALRQNYQTLAVGKNKTPEKQASGNRYFNRAGWSLD